MIAWLQPAAFWGLALLAVPVLIHLLRTRRAPTIPFPSVQFVRPSPVAAIRVGPPSDLLLLVIRAGIVALAVLALAQPLLLSPSRLNVWNARVARAIVVDRSESMNGRTPAGRTANEEAADIAAAEQASAAAAIRVEVRNLAEGLRRAARWLETAPPARREAVVVSDFQLGALDGIDVSTLPQGIGLRLVSVGNAGEKQIQGMRLLRAPGIMGGDQALRISPEGTDATLSGGGDPPQSGLRILAGGSDGDENALRRAVARAGAPAPSADRPIVIRFANAPAADAVAVVRDRWMIETIAALETNPELRRVARDAAASKQPPSDVWTVLLRDRDGNPLLRAAALGGELIIDASVPATSYFAALALQSALNALHGAIANPEEEVLRIPKDRLSAWSRAPAPVNGDVWRFADWSDARWCWLGTLVLLALEHVVRRRQSAVEEEHRAAA